MHRGWSPNPPSHGLMIKVFDNIEEIQKRYYLARISIAASLRKNPLAKGVMVAMKKMFLFRE